MNEYLLDSAWQQQRERLAGLESWFDPGAIRHMETVGVAPGWRCLEIGGGGRQRRRVSAGPLSMPGARRP